VWRVSDYAFFVFWLHDSASLGQCPVKALWLIFDVTVCQTRIVRFFLVVLPLWPYQSFLPSAAVVAGMARAMGATLMGAQKLLDNNQNSWLAVSSTSIFRPIQRLTAQLHPFSALKTNAIIRVRCASIKHCDKTAALWHNTTVRHCDRTRTLTCNIYKTSSSHDWCHA